MHAIRERGLSGKARRVRTRRRASRLYQQQLIEDYLMPQGNQDDHEKLIPVSQNKEFHPSVLNLTHQDLVDGLASGVPPKSNVVVESLEPRSEKSRSAHRTGSTMTSMPALNPFPIRFLSLPKPRVHPHEIRGQDEQNALTRLRGFFMGCSIGAAAAAFGLMVLQYAVG